MAAGGYDIGLSGSSSSGAAQSGAVDAGGGSQFGGINYGPGSLLLGNAFSSPDPISQTFNLLPIAAVAAAVIFVWWFFNRGK